MLTELTIAACPYCKGECIIDNNGQLSGYWAFCRGCYYQGAWKPTESEAIEVHNELCRNNAAAGALADAWAVLKTYPSIEVDLEEMLVPDDELTLDAQEYRDGLIAMNAAAALAKAGKELTCETNDN